MKQDLGQLGQTLAVLTTQATKASIANTRPGTEALCMGMSGAVGPLMIASEFLCPETSRHKVNDEQFFLVCLLMAEVCQIDSEGTGAAVNFNPGAVAKAMENFQKLTGRDPRSFMHPGLVGIADEKPELNSVDLSKFSRFLPQ